MRKWLLVGSVIVIVTVVVAVALVLNINTLIARNKDYLIAQAEQALWRKIKVAEVEATLVGGIGVRLSNFAMSEDPDYGAEDFVQARDLQVNLKLWPMLRREVEIKRLILHEPVIRIVRNATGDFNFSTVGKSREQKEREGKEKRQAAAEKRRAAPALLIAAIDISGGDLHYIDQADGTDLELRQVDLQVDELEFGRPFQLKLAAAIYAERQNFKLDGVIGPLREDGDWTRIPIAGEMNIDALDFSRIKRAAPKLRKALSREFDLSGTFSAKSLRFKGTLKDFAVSGQVDGTHGDVRLGKGFGKPAGVPLTLQAVTRYSEDKLAIQKSTLKLHTLELAGAGEIQFSQAPVLNLSVESKPASLAGWDKLIPAVERYQLSGTAELRGTVRGAAGRGAAPQMQGTLRLRNASAQPPDFPKPVQNLDTVVSFTGQRADIRDLALTLGRSRIQVAAAIEKFSPLTFQYKLSTPELWPADYTRSEGRKADVIRSLRSEGRLVVGEGGLRYQGKLASADGTLHNVNYKNLEASLRVANQVASIETLRVNALSGQIRLQGNYTFAPPKPVFSMTSQIHGVDVKELYTALDARAERDIQGRLNADMKLSGGGKSWEEIKPALQGEGQAEINDGVIYNFNIAESALSGITGIPGLTNALSPSLRKKYPETFTAKDTEFKELKTSFDLAGGRINLKNTRMSAAEFVVAGSGWVDFNRRVESRAVLTFSQRLSADLAQSAREVRYLLNRQGQLEMPFSVSGRMPNVRVKPDSSYLGQLVQRNFLQRGSDDFQDRFLGRSDRPEDGDHSSDQGASRRRRSTEDRIRRGLENLFRR